jgi:hypothetical protein
MAVELESPTRLVDPVSSAMETSQYVAKTRNLFFARVTWASWSPSTNPPTHSRRGSPWLGQPQL